MKWQPCVNQILHKLVSALKPLSNHIWSPLKQNVLCIYFNRKGHEILLLMTICKTYQRASGRHQFCWFKYSWTPFYSRISYLFLQGYVEHCAFLAGFCKYLCQLTIHYNKTITRKIFSSSSLIWHNTCFSRIEIEEVIVDWRKAIWEDFMLFISLILPTPDLSHVILWQCNFWD